MNENQKKERLYPNLIQGMIDALNDVFKGRNHASQVLASTLKQNKKWGSRDRAFVAENFYGIVRWYRLFYEILGHEPKSNEDWWHIFGISKILEGTQLPPWKEFEGLDAHAIQQHEIDFEDNRAVVQSIPDWIDKIGAEQIGEEWNNYLTALNETAALVLRSNRLKTTPKKLKNALASDGIDAKLLAGDALLVPTRAKLQNNEWYKKGWFEIQDLSSQQVARAIDVEAGMTVIDACAGAGGKSLHMASLMKNQGRIIAMDINARKLKELEKRARRNGITIIETVVLRKNTDLSKYHGIADRLLLDVPCSGLGVLRRKPDTKWKLKPAQLTALDEIQTTILNDYTKMVADNGKFMYATCSILPSENEERIQKFADENTDTYSLDLMERFKPQTGYDGFFMALLSKK